MSRLLLDLPDREAAREAAQRELSKRPYQDAQPPLVYRVIRWVIRKLSELLDRTTASVPGGRLGLLLIVLLVVGIAVVVFVRLRPTRTGRYGADLFEGARALTAEEHRRQAEQAVARGEFAEAVRERLRAVVRELEERGLLDARPGRTADEVAREAGAAVASLGEPLRRATTVFAEVWYGGHVADASSYAVLVEVDRLVGGTRLVVA